MPLPTTTALSCFFSAALLSTASLAPVQIPAPLKAPSFPFSQETLRYGTQTQDGRPLQQQISSMTRCFPFSTLTIFPYYECLQTEEQSTVEPGRTILISSSYISMILSIAGPRHVILRRTDLPRGLIKPCLMSFIR